MSDLTLEPWEGKLYDGAHLTGTVAIYLNNELYDTVHNMVVNTGKAFIASRMKDATAAVMTHLAIGTNATGPSASDTTLGSEAARVAIASTIVSTNQIQYTATFPAGTGTGAITEAGCFNAPAAGDMLCRSVFAVVNKLATDTMSLVWTITIS